MSPAADPGFPIGGGGGGGRGASSRWGSTDLRCGHFSVEIYTKMKELGGSGGAPLDPPLVPLVPVGDNTESLVILSVE